MKGGSCQRRGTPPQLKGTPQEGERGGRRRGGGGGTHPVALKKEIGLLSACGLIVGNIIGSGIFVSPKGVLEQVGAVGPALGVWGLSGVLTGVGSLCYAELGVTIPRAGGDYAYVKEVFGGMAGFLRLWIAVLVIYPTNQAVIALTFATYALHPLFQPCPPPQTPLRLLAACCLLLLTWVNCRSVRWATRVQDLFTGGKLLALALIIGTGGVQIARGHTHWLSPAQAFLWAEPPSVGGVALGLLQGSFAYGGWNFLNYVTEELRDPPRNLPRAIFISIPLVTSIYLLANVAYLTALAPQDIITSNAVAVTFGERLLGSFSWLMPLAVALSTFGGVNGSLFTCSRLFYAGAREGHLPPLLAMIHVETLTPIPALLLSCVSTLLMLVTGDIYTLINYVGFVNYLWYGVTVGGLLVLRWREPHRPRPLRISLFFPAIYLFFWAALLVFAFWSEPLVCGVGLGIMAGGVPVYILGVRDQKGPPGIHRAMASLSLFGQRLCRVLYPLGGSQEEEEEEEGEGGTPLNPQTHT